MHRTNKALSCCTGVALISFGFNSFAATEQISSTNYNVQTKLPEKITLPDGRTVMSGGESHVTLVDAKTGEATSGWCIADEYIDKAGKPTAGAGFCTVVYDTGDLVWTSFNVVGSLSNAKQIPYLITGGTGKYAGATGSGVVTQVSDRGDGFAWTTKSTGSVTTK